MRVKLVIFATTCLLFPYLSDCLDIDECKSTREESLFRCTRIPQCIPRFKTCDQMIDCEDGSDEEDCHYVHEGLECPADTFPCSPTRCIKPSQLCDGERDCLLGQDEAHCGFTTSLPDCDELGCHYGCKSINGTGVCTCPEGMVVDARNKRDCIIYQPCENNVCQHACHYEDYDFFCTCEKGFDLGDDGMACIKRVDPGLWREITILVLTIVLVLLILGNFLYCLHRKSQTFSQIEREAKRFRNLANSMRNKFPKGLGRGDSKIAATNETFQESI